MGSEKSNGRGSFVHDREHFTGQARRELNQLKARREDARKEIAECEATLKRFEGALGTAFLEGKDPPRAAMDLQHRRAKAKQTLAACDAVIPEKERTLEAMEVEWAAKAKTKLEARVRELLEDEMAAARLLAEKQAARTEAFADIKHAARWFPLPELAVMRPKLDRHLDTIAAWPPKPKKPSGIRVRRTTLTPERLDPEHRLAAVLGSAFVLLRLDTYALGEVFCVPPKITVCKARGTDARRDVIEEYDIAELLPHLGLEVAPDANPMDGTTPWTDRGDRMSNYRQVEWKGTSAGHFPGRRERLPKAEAAEAIAAGRALGVTPVRFLAAQLPYAPGEEAGFYDHVAERLIRLGWAEPVEVPEPVAVRPPDADVDPEAGTETSALQRPPVDRMVRAAPKTKEIKS